jgi:two-component system KDP operon response regulator KdpE
MSDAASHSAGGALLLLVEDEPQLRRFLAASLPAHGFTVLEADAGGSGIVLAEQRLPDLVLLDLGLPDMDGVEVIRRLRTWSRVPVIVLSARGLERQKVEALDAGADDYLTKPFGFGELLARMRAALRRATTEQQPGATAFEAGPLRVDLPAHRVWLDGQDVHLTPIEFKMLVVLVKHAGKLVTHRQLLEQVWGPHAREQTHYLRVHMAHLRRKLEPDPSLQRWIVTEAGVGYRLELTPDA